MYRRDRQTVAVYNSALWGRLHNDGVLTTVVYWHKARHCVRDSMLRTSARLL